MVGVRVTCEAADNNVDVDGSSRARAAILVAGAQRAVVAPGPAVICAAARYETTTPHSPAAPSPTLRSDPDIKVDVALALATPSLERLFLHSTLNKGSEWRCVAVPCHHPAPLRAQWGLHHPRCDSGLS